MYLCRQLHWIEDHNKSTHNIYCSGCNRTIPKFHTYTFTKVQGKYYLARQSVGRRRVGQKNMKSRVWTQPRFRAHRRWYMRQYRLKKKAEQQIA